MAQSSRVRMSDIKAVATSKLIVAAMIGAPIGFLLALIFTVIVVNLMPAGDLVFILNPPIGAIGAFILGPMIVVRRSMARLETMSQPDSAGRAK